LRIASTDKTNRIRARADQRPRDYRNSLSQASSGMFIPAPVCSAPDNHETTKGSISLYNIAGLIFDVSEEVATQIAKNCSRQPPHSHLRSPPRGIPESIPIYLIFPETRVIGLHFYCCMYGSIFIQICAVGSKRRIFSAPECVLAVQGRSGSSKVDDYGTNRKRVCDFLLVGHCDYGPILHRF